MDDMIETLQSIHRGDDGSNAELRRLESALKSLQDREGNTSQRSSSAIKRLAELMVHDQRVRRLKEGKFELLGNYQTLFLNLLKADASVVLGSAGETDEVVTIDVRRQIRWPTSLHGKSGMRVSEFPLARLDPDSSDAYNPLHEAYVLGLDDRIEVEWTVDDAVAQFGDQRFESEIGKRFSTHESGATFLVLKGWASLV
jgi:DNA primase small subunit